MTFQLFIFYTFSAILLYAATMVITRRNPVHSALFLVLAFASSAGLWMLAEAEFLAIVLVLVYVGAVMVLFLFVVMMLDVDTATMRAGFIKYLPVGALVAFTMAVEMFLVVGLVISVSTRCRPRCPSLRLTTIPRSWAVFSTLSICILLRLRP